MTVSVDSLGRPPRLRNLNFQKSRELWRCQRECVGFEDQEAFFPVLNTTGEKDEPEVVGLRKGGLVDLTVEDHELLPEESILYNQFGSTAREVCGGAENNRVAGRLGEM